MRAVRVGTQFRSVYGLQRRFATPYMPWPYDKYKRPGSAKYWLSKYPPADQADDQYAPELIYLDELDKRVSDASKTYTPSDKWKTAYNEYNWQDHDNVTTAYGNVGGDVSQELLKTYGRGNKIDPSHYFNPTYNPAARQTMLSQYMHPDLRKRNGPLKNMLGLPPDEQSVFKLWNPTTMAGALAIILYSKEWFMIGHDFWHGVTFWMAWAIIISVVVDWWTWWAVLRGQEFYDHTFMPLNERVQDLFKQLNKLESQPSFAKHIALMGPYVKDIANRSVEKRKTDGLVAAAEHCLGELEQKLKAESSTKVAVGNSFKETAFQQSIAKLEDAKARAAYMDQAVKSLAGNAEFKTGQTLVHAPSTAFKDTYDGFLAGTKSTYMQEQRKAGTLPWVFADQKEIDAKMPTKESVKARHAAAIKAFEAKYHKVPNLTMA